MTIPSVVPKNVVDRMFSAGVQFGESWLVHGEVSFVGRLDRARLVDAVGATVARHPLLRSVEIDDSWHVSPAPRIPQLVVSADLDLDAARRVALERRFDLSVDSPIEITIVPGAAGDSLIVVGDHRLIDGVAMFRVLADLGAAYAGTVLDPEVTWAEAHDLAVVPAFPSDRSREIVAELRARTRTTAKRFPDRDAGCGGCGSDAVVARLPEGGDTSGGTNDRLLASLVAVIRRCELGHGRRDAPISVGMPINLRPLRSWDASVCNSTLIWPIVVPADVADHDVLACVAAQSKAARLGRRSRSVRGALAELPAAGPLPLWAVRAMATTTLLSSVLHLAGRFTFGPDAPAVATVWGTPPSSSAHGMVFGACLDEGQRWIAARFLPDLFERADVVQLLDAVVETFDALNRRPRAARLSRTGSTADDTRSG